MAVRNFDDLDPAAPAGTTNCRWQVDLAADPPNISSYMPVMIGDDDPSSPLAAPESGAVPAPVAGDAAAGRYLKADGTWEVPPGVSGGTFRPETPVGTLDGSNTVFTLPSAPPSGSLLLLLNGVAQNPGSGSPLSGADFTLTGSTITYSVAPRSDDWHIAFYSH